MSLTNKDFDIIANYLQGRLSAEEKSYFNQQLSGNPDFREEYEFQEALQDELFRQEKEEMIAFLEQEFADESDTKPVEPSIPPRVSSWSERLMTWLSSLSPRPVIGIATALLLVGVGIFLVKSQFVPKKLTNQEIYADYYQPEPTSYIITTVASIDTGENITPVKQSDIKEAYDSKNYQLALEQILRWYQQEGQKEIGIQLLESNCYMQVGQMDKAKNTLQAIINNKDYPTYIDKAQWYQALVYLKLDQPQEAVSLLTTVAAKSGDTKKRQQAQEILDILESRK